MKFKKKIYVRNYFYYQAKIQKLYLDIFFKNTKESWQEIKFITFQDNERNLDWNEKIK